ncbi:transporter substrate-binding domain-containing protein [Geobacter sp. FeAm09]|uniref:transporter substrate-binding domain-containing protein n=1 Tax=Geobacter sp. FeAm09 TaxID=2597769 RepID=UPI00197AB499|nr:transporter substrate-binding domain-containing protein [Geobacter sp. FeAm09]
MRIITATLVLAAVLAADHGGAQAGREASAPEGRKVIAAVPADFPPTYYRDGRTGQAAGFAVDVMNAVARRAGIRVEYVFGQAWDEIQEMVLSGKADVIPNLTMDAARQRRFIFTSPVETLPVSLVVRQEEKIDRLERGMKVGVMKGSVSLAYLLERGDIVPIPYDSLQKLLFDLLSGRLDIIMTAAPNLMKLAMEAGIEDKLKVLEPPLIEAKRGMALRPADRELADRLNRAINQFVGTPEYRAIYATWWGKPKPFWTTRRVAEMAAVLVVVTALAMAGWRYHSISHLNGELEKALHAARNERRKAQAVLDSLSDGISIHGPDFRVLYQNPSNIRQVGAHGGEHCYRVLYGRDRVCDTCPVGECFADGLVHSTVRGQAGEGGQRFFDVAISPLFGEDGSVELVIESVRDITVRKRMEETLQQQAAQLEQEIAERERAQEGLAAKQRELEGVNEVLAKGINEAVAELRRKDQVMIQQSRLAAMGEMISNIAHQWRQPLNNIGLIVQNLQLAYDAGEVDAALVDQETGRAMDVIMYMSQTIDDFRKFFRRDQEKHAFVVNKSVAKLLKMVSASLEDAHIGVELEAEEAVTAVGYQNEYAQVLLNILGNARDVLVERHVADPRIRIRIGRENGRAVVVIRDNGGGMNGDVLPKIFDPYFTTKEPGKGTGIGLYMSKVIIEQNMRGRLLARNVDGGAEFRVEV